MTDHDLTQIGIEAFGARRRMQQAIAGRIMLSKKLFLHFKETILSYTNLFYFRSYLGQYQSILMIMIIN